MPTIRTFIANNTPAIGALKIADIPAAASLANNKVLSLLANLKYRAILDQVAEPVETIGDSNWADTPKPIVSELEKIWPYKRYGGTSPQRIPVACRLT
jgi:hypothetical protein